MTITLRQLRRIEACEEQVILFKKRFGTSVLLTEALIIEHGKDFDLTFLASKIFTPEQRADYWAKRDVLRADYWANCDVLDADYRANCDVLLADYYANCDVLLADYEAKCALVFWAIAKDIEEVI